MTAPTRRRFLAAATGLAAIGVFGASALLAHRAEARILVIGGGPGGVAASGAIRNVMPNANVLIVERDPGRLVRTKAPDMISGRLEPKDYNGLAESGIEIALDDIRAIDWSTGQAEALSGRMFDFDRVVLAPGIAMRDEGIAGYDRNAAEQFPHGWTDRAGVVALATDIRAMPDGGTIIIRIPPGRMRYPIGPWRRADEIARYLAREKPRARVVLLDHSAVQAQKLQLLDRLAKAHAGRIGYVSSDQFGDLMQIDAANRTLIGTRRNLSGDVINFIPAQMAGRIAKVSGLTGQDGWCPVAPDSAQSLRHGCAYLIGEAQDGYTDDSAAGIARAAGAIATHLARSFSNV